MDFVVLWLFSRACEFVICFIMRKFVGVLLVAGLLGSGVEARGEGERSRLVVGMVVSHFYPEWLEMFRGDLSAGGFRRLMDEGARFEMDYGYLFSQTGVDHASVYTGVMPSEHGVVATAWYDRLRGKRQYAARSGRWVETGSRVADSVAGLSPEWLQGVSLGSVLRLQNAVAKVYSVAMDGMEAVLSGGSSARMAIWFGEERGEWVSSSYYGAGLPGWLERLNEERRGDFYARRGWMCLEDEGRSEMRVRLGRHFYYDVEASRREYGTYRVLKATPYGNTMVRELAERLVKEEGLGRDADPDLLAVGFSCLDYMYRDFEVGSAEARDVVMRLDRDVEAFLKFLDEEVGEGRYTVFLTFAEARELTPEDLAGVRVEADYFSVFRAVALLKSYLAVVYGAGDWVADYDQGQVYLNRELVAERGLDLKEVQDRVAEFLIEFEGVVKVMTGYTLTHAAFGEGVNGRVQRSFSHKRSGDVMFVIRPTWSPETREVEDTYFRYSRRYRVPLFFYGRGVKPGAWGRCGVEDVLPTLCGVMGITPPYTAEGADLF